MSVVVAITVEDVDTQILTYTTVQVFRAPTISGSFTFVGEMTLVAGQFTYDFEDVSGAITSFYRYRYHNPTGPVDSGFSGPFQPQGVTRRRIRQMMLENYRTGKVFVTGSGCTNVLVQTDDYYFKNTAFYNNRGRNSIITILDGPLAETSRFVVGSDVVAGTFSVNLLPSVPSAGLAFEWHWMSDFETYNNMINKALARYLYIDKIPIAGNSNQPHNEYSLDNYGWLNKARDVGGLGFYPSYTVNAVFRPWDGEGRWWNYHVDNGIVYVSVSPRLMNGDVVYLEAIREMPKLYDDTTVLPANASLDLCAALAYDELLKWLSQPGQGGTSEDYSAWRQARVLHHGELNNLIRINTPVFKGSKPRMSAPILTDVGPWKSR